MSKRGLSMKSHEVKFVSEGVKIQGEKDGVVEGADRVVRRLQEAGFPAYYAGGSVRDFLMGRVCHDIDIATQARPDEVQRLFSKVTDLQGKCFGVLRVLEGEHVYEVATFREDGVYEDGRRPSEVCFTTAGEDATRRDFTVNGLFYDPARREVLDYVGGLKDLGKKVLRAIGDPRERFREDYLRLFRAVRFAAEFGFELDEGTWEAMKEMARGSGVLAPERVRDELVKILTGADPGRGVDLLIDSGLMDVWIPEVPIMKGVEQPPQFHPEGDVYEHVHLMLKHLKYADPVVALGVLFHDISKPETYQVDATGRIRFNEHEVKGARKTEEIMRRLRFSNEMIEAVTVCVRNHMAFKDVLNMRLSKLKRFLSRPYLDQEMELHRIDCTCSHGDLSIYDFLVERRDEIPAEEIKPEPLVSGKDLIDLGLEPGPLFKKILTEVQDLQLEGKVKTREDALMYLKRLIEAYVG